MVQLIAQELCKEGPVATSGLLSKEINNSNLNSTHSRHRMLSIRQSSLKDSDSICKSREKSTLGDNP